MLASSSQVCSKQRKVNKEYRYFLLDDTEAALILNELQYPQLQEYCYLCSKAVTRNSSLICHFCLRSVHRLCTILIDLSSPYICQSCIHKNLCLKCKIVFFKYTRKVRCSICLKNLHDQCWSMPFQLNQHTKKFYKQVNPKMDVYNRIICQQCQSFWGTNTQIMMTVTIQDIKYVLVQVNHPSPIHFTWLNESQYNLIKQTKIIEEIMIVEKKQPIIEAIFSIHLISRYRSLNLRCIYKLMQETKIEDDFQNEKIYFLVKWEDREQLVWQTFQTVRPYDELIRNFFLQLNFNWLKLNKAEQEISLYVDYLMQDEQVHQKVSFLGNKIKNTSVEQQFSNNFLERAYNIYLKSSKQSLTSKDGSNSIKITVLCNLINTILFVKKQLKPILLFTSRNNIKNWLSNFTKQCPFHKCLVVTGLEQYIRCLVNKHFCSTKHRKQIFYSRIYLIDYNSFETILTFCSFQQIINLSTLVIMQETISPLARHFYDACGVAKIRLRNLNTENSLSLDIQSTSDRNSLSNQSNINSQNKRQYFEYLVQSFKQTQQQISNKYKNHQIFNQFQLNELQRLSFLKFVMLFGLQFQNSQVFIQQLCFFDKSTFLTEDYTSITTKIEKYIKIFFTVLYTNLHAKQLPDQIVKFFCFKLEPSEVFERIIFVNQLKKIVKKNIKEPKVNKAETQSRQTFLKSVQFSLMIFESVITNGFGRWQSISEFSKVWEQGIQKRTLRQHFCIKSTLNITLPGFCQVIKDRLMKFWRFIRTSKYLI